MNQYLPLDGRNHIIQRSSGITCTAGASARVISALARQNTAVFVNSVISGASYGFSIDGAVDIVYNASGLQTKSDIVLGLRDAVSSVSTGLVATSEGTKVQDIHLQLLANVTNAPFSLADVNAALSYSNVADPASFGVTTYKSPLALASTAFWQELRAPENAVGVQLLASQGYWLCDTSEASNGQWVPASVCRSFGVQSGKNLYLRGNGAAVEVGFIFETLD